jgi:hypothetical protein
MTKQKMIQTIQLQEAKLYLELKQAEQQYGSHDDFTLSCRTRWGSVHQLMQAMNIESDFTLPDNAKATAIICQLVREEREAA